MRDQADFQFEVPVFSHQCSPFAQPQPVWGADLFLLYFTLETVLVLLVQTGWLIRFTVCPFRWFSQQSWGLVSATGCWVRLLHLCISTATVMVLTRGGVDSVCQRDVKLHAVLLLVISLPQVHYFLSGISNLRDFKLAWGVWVLTQPCFTLGCLLKKKKKKLPAYLFACPYVLYTLILCPYFVSALLIEKPQTLLSAPI